eukprot:1902471-Pleurochrysis_carterae.AAC.1
MPVEAIRHSPKERRSASNRTWRWVGGLQTFGICLSTSPNQRKGPRPKRGEGPRPVEGKGRALREEKGRTPIKGKGRALKEAKGRAPIIWSGP